MFQWEILREAEVRYLKPDSSLLSYTKINRNADANLFLKKTRMKLGLSFKPGPPHL